MLPILQFQLDFVHFACGWVFILVALTAGAAARLDDPKVPWRWLASFGWIRGIYEWSEMLLISLPPMPLATHVRIGMLILSYLCLAEFARAFSDHRPGRWIHLLLIAVAVIPAFRLDAHGVLVSTHGALGLLASVWAALALAWSARKSPAGPRRPVFVWLAAAIFAQSLLSAWIAACTQFANSMREPSDATPLFLKLFRAAILAVMVFSLWAYCRAQFRRRLSAPIASVRLLYDRLVVVGLVIVMIAGWTIANVVGREKDREMREEILNRTKIAAATIDPRLVRQLTWSHGDLGQPYYETLKAQMMAIRGANEDLVFASLMGIRDSKSYVLVDSEPPESEDYSPPGQYYEEADPEYNRLLERRVPFVIGPLYDRWGVWMTGAVPITEVGPPPGAVALALDLNASHWTTNIARARLPVLLIALLIGGMILSFSVAQRRAHETAMARKLEAERIIRQKKAIVSLATSPQMSGTDFKAAAREITEIAVEALQVERVGVWLGGKHEGRLTCVDQYERSTHAHTEGQTLLAEPYPRYFEALATGRAIDAHDALSDPRTSEFRSVYLEPARITSMLDSPIRVSGRVVGVICFENVGEPRTWMEDEIRFAAETADQAAQALAHIERHRAEEAKRKLEQQIQYSQKLESLGVLAGGIAHDFNNMLMVILGNVDLALSELPRNSPVCNHLREVENISQRAAELCRQLLAYAGKGRFVIRPINLNRMILDMKNMLEISVSKKAVLQYTLAEELPAVEADAAQMQQVLMNLVINASESLDDREGTIVIATSHRRFESQELVPPWSAEPLPPGEYVVLQVSDTGCGIPPEVRGRIFEPFFTTKFSGRGLGLAAVMGIVQAHKGTIRVYSERGRGSVFRVLLPASKLAVAAQRETPEPDSWKTSGTILVVDDEEAVRRVTANMLEPCGLKVLTAADGYEAVEILRAHLREIDCVLLDLTMPRVDGGEAFYEIRKLQPDIPVILSSGYTEEVVAERFAGADFAAFIEKPYSRARLIEILKRVLRPA